MPLQRESLLLLDTHRTMAMAVGCAARFQGAMSSPACFPEKDRPLIVQLYGRVDACLCVAIESEHQRVRVQVVVRSKLPFNVRRRNVPPKI